ncbi:MAG: methionyl-tRNA formyltransferase, partial [Muribaculaceae bacterium]|nr:methionyl-tRNA formyltransferase [Muribaculaceae bacterium]
PVRGLGDVYKRLDSDNAVTVNDRLLDIGARLTLETVNSIENGTLSRIPQEHLIAQGEEATPAPKIFKDTCRIDWEKSALEIHNLVRGLAPYPAAWTELTLRPDMEPVNMKVTLTAITDRTLNPGEVLIDNGHLYVGTSTNAIELLQIQPSGKRSMPTADYLRGLH